MTEFKERNIQSQKDGKYKRKILTLLMFSCINMKGSSDKM